MGVAHSASRFFASHRLSMANRRPGKSRACRAAPRRGADWSSQTLNMRAPAPAAGVKLPAKKPGIVRQLKSLIAERSVLDHPFYQAWQKGEVEMDPLREYAGQYYPHVLAFPTYLSAVHANCPDLVVRQQILENLIEEERGDKNHPELWLRFAEGLGM